MLSRPQTYRCIECGMSSISPAFNWHYGDPKQGPAYWCDRGVLCSPKCSMAHHQRRVTEGTLPKQPADDIYSP